MHSKAIDILKQLRVGMIFGVHRQTIELDIQLVKHRLHVPGDDDQDVPEMAIEDMDAIFGLQEDREYCIANMKNPKQISGRGCMFEETKTRTIGAQTITYVTKAEQNEPVPWAQLFLERFCKEIRRLRRQLHN